MSNWNTYVKYSYQVILEAEHTTGIQLDHDTEAYVVHLFANYLDYPNLNKDPVCVRYLESLSKPTKVKKELLKNVGDECLLIYGLDLGRPRWPSNAYYQELGQMAYMSLAHASAPAEIFFEELAEKFDLIGQIIKKCKA